MVQLRLHDPRMRLSHYRCLLSHRLLRRWFRVHLSAIAVVLFLLVVLGYAATVTTTFWRIL